MDDHAAQKHFLNRELSWLEFNQRVLDEALDPGQSAAGTREVFLPSPVPISMSFSRCASPG